jgi:hypothetical protein
LNIFGQFLKITKKGRRKKVKEKNQKNEEAKKFGGRPIEGKETQRRANERIMGREFILLYLRKGRKRKRREGRRKMAHQANFEREVKKFERTNW